MSYTAWIIYGGFVCAVSFFVLAILWLACAKYFMPESVHMSWAEWPVLLVLTVLGGLIVGGWLGYELASSPSRNRAWLLADVFIIVVIMLLAQWWLRKVWSEPNAQHNFLPALIWQLVPLIPVNIYYHWLRHLIR